MNYFRGTTISIGVNTRWMCRRFGTLCRWCVKFLPRIFYPFWEPHRRKLRIGLFDRRATKWCFWLACDQNLDSVFLWWNYGSNFSKFWPVETLDLYANGPESFPPGFLTYFGFWAPHGQKFQIDLFDRRATKTRVWSFCPLCNYFPISVLLTNCATNGGLNFQISEKR